IEGAVAGGEIQIAARVHGGRAAAHPDAAARVGNAAHVVGGRIEDGIGGQGQGRCVEPDHPTVVRVVVFVGGPGHIHDAVDQGEPRTLELVLRVEAHQGVRRSVAGAGHGNGAVDGGGA